MNELNHNHQALHFLQAIKPSALFDQIFELRSSHQERLRDVEILCHNIVRMQLQDTPHSSQEDMCMLLYSELEQRLSEIFRSGDNFWEKYYSRRSKASQDGLSSSPGEVDWRKFGAVFIPLDFIFYCNRVKRFEYELLQLSLQSYVMGALYSDNVPTDSIAYFQKSLKVIGPLNLPAYKDLIMSCLDELCKKTHLNLQ